MEVRLIALTEPIVSGIQSQEQLIEYAGRKCTATCEKTGSNTQRFVKTRVKQGHTSILEHVNFTFEIDGISRSCLAQLTRHRIASYSVESMRYVKYNNVGFTYPDKHKWIYKIAYWVMFVLYKFLLQLKIKPENARFLLPTATHTNLIMTMNLREILHFLDLRLDKAAQWEIQELASKIKDIVIEYCPRAMFVDNEFKKYNHQKHVSAVKELKPKYATVRDAMTIEQCKQARIDYYPLEQILNWAEELSEYAENVIVIPIRLPNVKIWIDKLLTRSL